MLHNFNLAADAFSAPNTAGGDPFVVCTEGSAIVPQEGWQLALHSDLQPCLCEGLIDIPRSFSQWKKII